MLIRNARVIDPANATDEIRDIFIDGGVIAGSGNSDGEIIDAAGLIASPGLVDVHAHFRDPGQTEKETLHTGALAAAAGGYTSVVCMANTIPAVDSAAVLGSILERAAQEDIHIYQTAALTEGRNGRMLTDMAGLKEAGAAGFTDDGSPVTDAGLVKKAMQEAVRLDTVLSFHEEDPAYVWEAGINSGKVSETMGIRGADRRAEYTMIERDLKLALDTGARIDIQHVSARESVELIRRYKAKDGRGLIHAEAAPHHFSLTEEAVTLKGSRAKVNPPLRTEEDRLAVAEGLSDGTLDLIATDHAPHTEEEKSREILKCPSGMVGLETALSLGITKLVDAGHLTLFRLIELMSVNPARLYGIPAGDLSIGKPADLVIFDPEAVWTVSEEDLHSKSKNTPFTGMTLHGRVRYTISNGRIIYTGSSTSV